MRGSERLPISRVIAQFAKELSFDDIPREVVRQATLLILDAVGIAFASTTYDFSARALASIRSLGEEGNYPVVGVPGRFNIRDAALLNGIHIHGLDYDDTHSEAVCHTSAAALPTALLMGLRNRASTRDLVTAFVVASEISARVGMAAGGKFHELGFHPTGIANAFGAAAAAAMLEGGSVEEISHAQGIAGSAAAGLMQFAEDGTWTKRLHPGQAAAAGISAAIFAANGWSGPSEVYEGSFGLFNTHLPGYDLDLSICTSGLGDVWETEGCALKPYPVCHFIHSFVDASLDLMTEHKFVASDIERINTFIHPTEGGVVSYPEDRKRLPKSEYEAKFSLPYVVSCALVRGRFGLAELLPDALGDPQVLELAQRVWAYDDKDSDYPAHYPARVEIHLRSGEILTRTEAVNRGSRDRRLTAGDVATKFRANLSHSGQGNRAKGIQEAVLSLGDSADLLDFAEILC